jgi:nicotinamidase-related amidase
MTRDQIIPETESSVLLFIDMQEKFIPAMPENITEVIAAQKVLLQAASLLKLRSVVTEQYPKGLGHTLPELSACFDESWPVLEKTTFSAFGDAAVRSEISRKKVKTVILAGIEAHVCLLQTALDAVAGGYNTVLLADAVCSRRRSDLDTALKMASSAGVMLLSVESLLFMLMRDSRHTAFRDVSRLINQF